MPTVFERLILLKRFILSLLLCAMLITPVCAEPSDVSTAESTFFTESEADGIQQEKTGMHPIVWVFAAGGVGALALITVIINMGKQKR